MVLNDATFIRLGTKYALKVYLGNVLVWELPYDPTFEADYIFTTDEIVRYIGTKAAPIVPMRLAGNNMKSISSMAFSDNKDIIMAIIQDGIERIE